MGAAVVVAVPLSLLPLSLDHPVVALLLSLRHRLVFELLSLGLLPSSLPLLLMLPVLAPDFPYTHHIFSAPHVYRPSQMRLLVVHIRWA